MGNSERSDRRRATRVPERCKLAFRILRDGRAEARTVAAETRNLSASGLCMVAPSAVETDTHLALEISLGGKPPIVAIGRVVWCDQDGETYRIGVCFDWMREEDRKAVAVIASYVQSRLED
jgi:c-di-GMP-binding flagellar brake protein YcgR